MEKVLPFGEGEVGAKGANLQLLILRSIVHHSSSHLEQVRAKNFPFAFIVAFFCFWPVFKVFGRFPKM